jgi:hypothetical protein
MKGTPQPEVAGDIEKETGLTKKQALDILLKNVAESKQQIAKGQFYTHEQIRALIDMRK